jgi:tetratricopeptide (TPR) repeat protein
MTVVAASPAELQAQGLEALRQGRFDEAEACYRELVALQRHPGLLNNLGLVLVAQRRHAEAVPLFEEALRARPGDVNVRVALSSALMFCDRPAEALARCEEALAIDADHVDARHNRAVALGALNRNAEAIAAFAAALAARPDDADAQFNLGVNELLLGRYESGWRHYEARWRGANARAPLPRADIPSWREGEALDGRHVLAMAEQGLGDTLNFVRWLPALAAHCARVDLQVQAPLVALVRRNLPGIEVEALGAQRPASADVRLPLMSLPLALGIGAAFDSFEGPYIHADPARVAKWRERWAGRTRPRIGLAWQCSRTHRRYASRSVPLRALEKWLAASARAGFDVVVLHDDVNAEEREWLARFAHVQVPGRELADFDDTAAVLATLDRVVTVDTAVAHLAGAMARPVTLLLQFAPDFRWQLGRESIGLYPTMRLLRQPAPGDWGALLDTLVGEMR